MSQLEEKPKSARSNSSRTSSPNRGFSQIVFGYHSDDHYDGHQYSHNNKDLDDKAPEGKTSDDLHLSSGEVATESSLEHEPNIVAEVMDDVENGRDLEVGNLDKTKTAGSKQT